MRSKIQKITTGKSGTVYSSIVEALRYSAPHKFVGKAYQRYLDNYPNNQSMNGRIFEYLICETLAQGGITPFYYQACFERVPNADFDVVLYDPTRPIALTMKVSLRERYKQADLEGAALRNVYRQAESYLITLSGQEAANVSDKIKAGGVAGLSRCLRANKPEYSELITELSGKKFCLAERVMPISGKEFQ